MLKTIKKNPKILLIQYRPAGDVILLTPVVRAIKNKYPESKIFFLVNEKESSLIKDYKLIDEIIEIKKIPKKGINYFRYLKYNAALYSLIRKKKFYIVIDFIGNPRSAMTSLISGAKIRIGRKLGARSIAYNIKIKTHKPGSDTVSRRLAHLKPLGIDAEYSAPELMLNSADSDFGKDYISSLRIKSNRPVIMLAPNSPRSSRRWKAEYFAETGRILSKKYDAKILIAWGPGEENYTKNITELIGSDAEMIPLTSLTQMGAIFSHCSLIITNCSGAKHIANAVGVRSITIYGPTNPFAWNHPDMKNNPALWADVECIRCEENECPLESHICMEKVTPAMVIEKADSVLNAE